MNYEDFFSAADVATFKRVKRGTMDLASVARDVAASMVGGTIDPDPSHRQYVHTRLGVYRLCMDGQSDNAPEVRMHYQEGAEIVVMGDRDSLDAFFKRHIGRRAYGRWMRAVRASF